ncbi:MAG TPA: alpha/beta hydrolase, partial [Myxococcota bacterium]|nr:alpha/beta hydrolase [Myxococcota bacterium]
MSSPGSPRAICLHGFPDGPETFGPMRAALEDAGVRTFAPHLPGHHPDDAQAFLRVAGDVGAIPAALV